MSAEGEVYRESGEKRSSETVAGFLSAIAIFISVIGIAWHPLRLILPGLALALIASGMGTGKGRLQFAAVHHLRRLLLLRADDRRDAQQAALVATPRCYNNGDGSSRR